MNNIHPDIFGEKQKGHWVSFKTASGKIFKKWVRD